MKVSEAELRRRILRVMVRSGVKDARRRARELARFLTRGGTGRARVTQQARSHGRLPE